ncbi:MAG TPA: RidA family protein [bacterium]
MIRKTSVHTEKAPKGPYSQAVVVESGRLVFASGQLPVDPTTGNVVEGGIETQTEWVLKNLEAVLSEAGSGLSKAVKTMVFLKNMDDFAVMNRIYVTFFKTQPPARSTVQVARLPKDVLIEIECVALAD